MVATNACLDKQLILKERKINLPHWFWERSCKPINLVCADCNTRCDIDESIPCSPCCEHLDEHGNPSSMECLDCDAFSAYINSQGEVFFEDE